MHPAGARNDLSAMVLSVFIDGSGLSTRREDQIRCPLGNDLVGGNFKD